MLDNYIRAKLVRFINTPDLTMLVFGIQAACYLH